MTKIMHHLNMAGESYEIVDAVARTTGTDIASQFSITAGTNMSAATIYAAVKTDNCVMVACTFTSSTQVAVGSDLMATITYPTGCTPLVFADDVAFTGEVGVHCRIQPDSVVRCRVIGSVAMPASRTIYASFMYLI